MSYCQHEQPASSDLTFTVPGQGEITIEFKWKQLNGRDEVSSITIEPADPNVPFEAVLLRKIPWVSLINQSRKSRAEEIAKPSQARPRAVGPDSTRTLGDDDLQYVADLYLHAWQLNIPVQRHVADALKIALPTAARRISLARQRGFISRDINPPTSKKGPQNDEHR
jgi:hypothetical protein